MMTLTGEFILQVMLVAKYYVQKKFAWLSNIVLLFAHRYSFQPHLHSKGDTILDETKRLAL